MQQVSYGPLIMNMFIMSCYTGFFNVRRGWQSLNTGPRFYLRLIRRIWYVRLVYLLYIRLVFLLYVKGVYLWYVSHRFWLSCLGPLVLFLKQNLMLFGFPIFQPWAYLMKLFHKCVVLNQISTFLLLLNEYMIFTN